jgi:RNA-directed DNA polymerase
VQFSTPHAGGAGLRHSKKARNPKFEIAMFQTNPNDQKNKWPKQEKNGRALYDRVYRRDTLETAYKLCRENDGAAGYDGITFKKIETSIGGVSAFIDELEKSLKERSYHPKPVKRTYILKKNGKLRPPGIPCIYDRVIQRALLLIIEPIFEADFLDCSHGFRPKRNAHDAMAQIQANLKSGRKEVYDADLSSYFDTIDHAELMQMVEERIADQSVLKLIAGAHVVEVPCIRETQRR